ncbi:DUF4179 domain-containing protein [Shouchella clausii]
MDRVDHELAQERSRTEAVTAPEGLEKRLRRALEHIPAKPGRSRLPKWTAMAVAAAILLSVGGYHYEAFAYYSQKILGFDEVMTDSLKGLNEAGFGQTVDQRIALGDGTELTVSGVMADANDLILYYALRNPDGISEQTQRFFQISRLTGFLTDVYAEQGTTTLNGSQTELIGSIRFGSVNAFAKKLTLHYSEQTKDNRLLEGTLTFPYHPNKAIQTQIRQTIKKKVSVDQGSITFRSITATPLSTVIKGTWDVGQLDRVSLPFDGVELVANGKPVPLEGSGFSHSAAGKTFELRYKVLPADLKSLYLNVHEFPGYEKLDEKVKLKDVKAQEPVSLAGKELWIKQVEQTKNDTRITLVTDGDILLDGVTLETAEGTAELQTTVGQKETEQPNGRVLKERTLLFDSSGQPEVLRIEGIHYRKVYNKTVDIPVD